MKFIKLNQSIPSYPNHLLHRSTFYYLLSLIQDHPLISKEKSKRHDYLTPEEQLAIALRYCASGDSFEGVGGMCGASRSSVHNSVVSVAIALFQHASAWIHFPTSVDEAKCVVTEFEHVGNWRSRQRGGVSTPGIPQIVGAMDGTQVLLSKRPENSGDAYINRKFWPALNVQAVVDARMRFMDVNVGSAGRCHDSSVLEHSPLGAQISDPGSPLAQLFEAAKVNIGGVDVPLQIIADSAYPSRRYVLPAYRDSQAYGHPQRARFNDKHSTTRNVVERAFGVLKQRWRCLLRGSEASVITTSWVVLMCFILHNVCMEMNDPEPYADEEYEQLKRWYDERMEQSSGEGEEDSSSQRSDIDRGMREILVTFVNSVVN